MTVRTLQRKLYRHEVEVDATEWADWAASAENRQALTARLGALGLDARAVDDARDRAASQGWQGSAALNAVARFAQSVVTAGAMSAGAQAGRLLQSCLQRLLAGEGAPEQVVPAVHWAVRPAAAGEGSAPRLRLRGAVLLRISGRGEAAAALPAELAAVLAEPPEPAWRTLWRPLRDDTRAAPGLLAVAAAFTTLAVGLELPLLRGLFDLAPQLNSTGQRLGAAAALLAVLLLRPA